MMPKFSREMPLLIRRIGDVHHTKIPIGIGVAVFFAHEFHFNDIVVVGMDHDHAGRSVLLDPLVELFVTRDGLRFHQSVFALDVNVLLGFAGILKEHEKFGTESGSNLLE